MKLLVTGGAGFIGSAVVRQAIAAGHEVVNLDALTYAACLANLAEVEDSPRYAFEQADIRDRAALDKVFALHAPDAVMHLAAESHVDRSIDGPSDFVDTNITGTFNMLEAARKFWAAVGKPGRFRFHHVSTDEPTNRCCSPKRPPMIRARPIRPPRRLLTIWCAPGTRPTGCRWC